MAAIGLLCTNLARIHQKLHPFFPRGWHRLRRGTHKLLGPVRIVPKWLLQAYSSHTRGDSFMIGEDGQENIPHREWLLVYDSVMQEIKDELKAQDREGEFVGSKVSGVGDTFRPVTHDMQIIYTTIRYITPEELEWYLEDCITLKQEFPHLICGQYST